MNRAVFQKTLEILGQLPGWKREKREKIRQLAKETDYIVLSHADQAPRRTRKAPHAFVGLLLMVALVASGWQPIHVAAFAAATRRGWSARPR